MVLKWKEWMVIGCFSSPFMIRFKLQTWIGFVTFQQWIAYGNLLGELNFVQFARNPNIELINVTKFFLMSFNACMWYLKLLCDLSCRTKPAFFYHCFYFVVVNFSFASRAWCNFEVKICETKTSKPILALENKRIWTTKVI